jgi:organic hydroperoxide reductase OsmC/OhrA
MLHRFEIRTNWTGNNGTGTSGYTTYKRDHEIEGLYKQTVIPCSSSPDFRGDPHRYNPEELLVASLSACHMLWMLHLCAEAGILVTSYTDHASGSMKLNPDGSGQFEEAVLKPLITITDGSRIDDVLALNTRAHSMCFIACSVNFPVRHEPQVRAVASCTL